MTSGVLQDGRAAARAVLGERCAALGFALASCDSAGALDRAPLEAPAAAARTLDALLRSRLLARRLEEVARAWADQDRPEPVELLGGFWAIGLPETHRRKRSGYLLAIALEHEALNGELFHAACQSASLDAQAARTSLEPLARQDRSAIAIAARTLGWIHQDRVELGVSEESVTGFSRQLTEAYEEISLLQKLGRSMNELAQPEKFVRLTCQELHATLAFRWIAAGFVRDARLARLVGARPTVSGDAPSDRRALESFLSRTIAGLRDAGPVVLEADCCDTDAASRNALVQPVLRDGKIIGAIVAGEKQGDDPEVLASDVKLLDAASQHLTILLENAALYEGQQSMFLGTLQALSSAIDAKDRYTCGHSERVAHLGRRLAEAIGMDAERVERVRIAGLVHDIGKIGVPEQVLCKPGKLTDEEFELIKQHPVIGQRILDDIPQLADVLPAVMHHHERWDGRGYPGRLAGRAIPLYARLIGLADAFDAMSSTRTYRSALPRATVLAEIVKCAGAQFDPDLAPIFAKLDFSEYDAMVKRHQERERRGAARGEAA